MTAQPVDLYEMLKKIRYDCTAIQAKVTDALNILNALNLPDPSEHVCPHCGITRPGANPLAEHVYQSHGGDVPPHWVAIEARSVSDVDETPCGFTITSDNGSVRECVLFAGHDPAHHFLIEPRA